MIDITIYNSQQQWVYFTGTFCQLISLLHISQLNITQNIVIFTSMNNQTISSLESKIISQQQLTLPYKKSIQLTEASKLMSPLKTNGNYSSQKFKEVSIHSSQHILINQDKHIQNRLMELEGQCKVKDWTFLQFNLTKTIFLMILLIITVFGLFALKYSAWFRKMVFFNEATAEQATHLYIKGNDKQEDIVKIIKTDSQSFHFQYKKLKYSISSLNNGKPTPVGYEFQKQFNNCFHPQIFKKGLSSEQVLKRRQLYGANQHLVETPTYPQYLLDVMTEPFFLLQYCFCFIFFLQGYAAFSIALLSFSFVTTTINYIMLYVSYRKIKEIAEKIIKVSAIRDGAIVQIDSKQLVPGDIYVPDQQQEIPADCIVGMGDIYVNQANLTGESFPIGKFKIEDLSDTNNSSIWIYQGSKVLETKTGTTFAVVINTGFGTHRGRIIRKILNRKVKDPDILRTTLIFVIEVVFVSFVSFFAILYLLLQKDIEKIFVFFKFIDFLASSCPPPLPIFFNLAYSFSLIRLAYLGINSTEPQKTVDGAQVKTFCFDKTGTLTQNDVSISKIFKVKNSKHIAFHNILNEMGQEQNFLVWQLFATCHTTKLINSQLLGDEIDKQMFKFINAKMETTNDPNIRFVVKSTKQFAKESAIQEIEVGRQEQDMIELQKKRHSLINMKNEQNLEVLRINQFQSKFQSMSVLIRDVKRQKYFIFAKGSPQKLLANSANIPTKSEDSRTYMKMIKTLSLNGFRTIAMGYRQLGSMRQVEIYLKADRQKYLEGIINLGLIAFENRLKTDAWLTINRLIRSNIDPKMITGDNIYIAVETARRAGIIENNQKVVFLEGNRNILNSLTANRPQVEFSRIFEGTIIHKIEEDVEDTDTSNFMQQAVEVNENGDYLEGNYTFAVDNAFLTMDPPPLLSHNIKIFARIPPQSKALVIKQYKKQHNQYITSHYSRFTRWLKTKKWKIGMCGDGANDLLALRQADLSIGIQATDASYGSSFTVKNILDVDMVIKESKCTQANIIHVYQFYGSISLFILVCSIVMIQDVTYFTTPQLMYLNFGTILLIPGTLGMSRPYGEESEFVPDTNMMGLHNHLIFWGNIIIPFAGVLGSWFYYQSTPEFLPNPRPTISIANGGFNSKNHCATLIFILIILVSVCNGFIIYRSKPWRERCYRNYLYTLLHVSNFVIALVFAFKTKQLEQQFQFQPISNNYMGVCIGIMFGALALNLIFNIFVDSLKLDHKKIVLDKSQARLGSYINKNDANKVLDSTFYQNVGIE